MRLASLLLAVTVVTGTLAQTAASDCSQATILAQGIALNIQDQRQEQAALAQVNKTLQAKPVNMTQFQTDKMNLLKFVNNGIAIRQMNQLITPAGNKATAGLAIVSQVESSNKPSALKKIRHE